MHAAVGPIYKVCSYTGLKNHYPLMFRYIPCCICSELDFLNLKCHDFSDLCNCTSHGSPLYPRSEEVGEAREHNVVNQ